MVILVTLSFFHSEHVRLRIKVVCCFEFLNPIAFSAIGFKRLHGHYINFIVHSDGQESCSDIFIA